MPLNNSLMGEHKETHMWAGGWFLGGEKSNEKWKTLEDLTWLKERAKCQVRVKVCKMEGIALREKLYDYSYGDL